MNYKDPFSFCKKIKKSLLEGVDIGNLLPGTLSS